MSNNKGKYVKLVQRGNYLPFHNFEFALQIHHSNIVDHCVLTMWSPPILENSYQCWTSIVFFLNHHMDSI